MASIEKRPTSKGTSYDVRYRLADGRLRRKTFRTRRESEQYKAVVEADRLRGVLVDPALGKVTFKVWANKWLDSSARTKRATTVARDRCAVTKHLIPAFGARRLTSITPLDVRHLVDHWTTFLAPRSVRTYYAVLQAILNSAVNADVIARTPCRGVRLPPPDRTRPIRFLNEDELQRLAEAMPVEYRPMVFLAGVLGLRWSEVAGLRVGRVDIGGRTLEVTETIAEVNGHVLRADVKTQSARRVLPLPSFLAELLAEHLAARGLTQAETDALLFVAPGGGPVRAANFRGRVWKPATIAAGLKGLKFHDLRHTNVGLLIGAGTHPAVIQCRIGHSSIRTTLDVYGHVLPDTDQAATDHLERLFASSTGES